MTATSHDVSRTRSAFDRRLYLPMVLGSVLNPINSSIIAVSLIPIGRALGEPPSQTAWLVSSLYVATAIGQPLVGRLVDVLGPRRLFLIGTALVGVAGVMGLVAQDLWTLVAARVVLGFGTCAGYPSAMYLIRSEAQRTGEDSPSGVLTLLAVSNQTIAVIGPTLGGLLIAVGGWRSTFAVNLPLSILCLWLGARRLPRGRPVTGDEGPRPHFDVAGVVLFAGTLTAAMFFLLEPRLELLPLLGVALVLAAAFAWVETRVADPFVDLHVLRGNLPLVATYVRMLLSGTVSYCFLYGYSQWLQDGRGLGPAGAGLLLIPTFAAAIGVSTAFGRHPAIRGKLVVGGAVQAVVGVGLFAVGGATSVWWLGALALLLGIPQGLLNLANQNAVYHQAEPARIASSAGLLRTFMYLGAILASAANGLFFHHRASTAGLHHLAVLITVLAVLMLVLTVLDRSLGRVGRDKTTADLHIEEH